MFSTHLVLISYRMHYLGLGGASYYTKPKIDWRELTKSSQSVRLAIGEFLFDAVDYFSRSPRVGISVMCAAIVLFCFLVALFDALTRRSIRSKARSIVVASASFDKTGKLLVKNDGTIPMQVISTDADLQVCLF